LLTVHCNSPQEIFQIESDEVFSVSFALGAGLASINEGTRGALAGGAIVISCFCGRRCEEFFKSIFNKKAIYLTKKIYNRFIQGCGSCLCKDI